MAILGTFAPSTGVFTSGGHDVAGSWNVVSVPTKPGPRTFELTMSDVVARVKSVFTGQEQVQSWPGADYWSLSFSLPPMQRPYYAPWAAFLAELRGSAAVFQFGDPYCRIPQGTPKGVPVVNGSPSGITNPNAVMSTTLYTRGWTHSQFRLLMPQDYLQIGQRLHMVVDQVNSDSSGNAAISIFPSIRDTVTDGQSIILNNCTGLFRLAGNDRKWSISASRTAAIDITAVEAR